MIMKIVTLGLKRANIKLRGRNIRRERRCEVQQWDQEMFYSSPRLSGRVGDAISAARAASAAARGRGARAAGPCWLVCSLACAATAFLLFYLLCRCTCLTWFNPGVVRVWTVWCHNSSLER